MDKATGTYKWDKELKKVVKVSDETPRIGFAEAGVFDEFVDTHIDGVPRRFSSRRKWKEELNNRGMFEVPKDALETKFWDTVREKRKKRRSPDPAKIAADALGRI